MHVSKKGLISGVIALSLVLPALTQAAWFSDTQLSDIEAAMRAHGVKPRIVEKIKMRLSTTTDQGGHGHKATTTASTTPHMAPGQVAKMACIALTRNLGPGTKGDDVKKLQELLAADPDNGFTAGATGFFGPLTARAMAHFQMKHGIASTTTGNVGPLTRAFFHRSCGLGLGNKGEGEQNDDAARVVVTGTITATSTSSITVKNLQNVLKTVNITASTTIKVFTSSTTPPTNGSKTDLVVGKRVRAEGRLNANGSLEALRILVGILP